MHLSWPGPEGLQVWKILRELAKEQLRSHRLQMELEMLREFLEPTEAGKERPQSKRQIGQHRRQLRSQERRLVMAK